jgi:hypothetical protein
VSKFALDINHFITLEEDLPRPQWPEVETWIKANVSLSQQTDAWNHVLAQWIDVLADALDGLYYCDASANFFLLAPDLGPNTLLILPVAEACKSLLTQTLHGVADFQAEGKLPILVLDRNETYYQYLAPFYPDGHFGASTGIQIRQGYPHVALLHAEFFALEGTLAHELTHASLAHLSLPLWIEEGLAQMFARSMSSQKTMLMDDKRAQKHKRFWSNHGLSLFFSGEGFYKATPAQRFSYELAEVLITLLVEDHRPQWFGLSRSRQHRFFEFLRRAHEQDCGDAAACEHLGYSLAEIAAKFLGPGIGLDCIVDADHDEDQGSDEKSA